jgi:hypothetical protein
MVIDYNDEVEGIEKDKESQEDYSEISEEFDDEDIEMTFPEEEWSGE